ncbi:DUF7010 family protein [Litorimonas sp.]|uniref:DUF7010 family protein n=1 Tax=Litorimonas sp. TaxID=1892381 RepID=UPI003A851C23
MAMLDTLDSGTFGSSGDFESAANLESLKQALKDHRQAQYLRLRGGFPIPLAGLVYWGFLGGIGFYTDLGLWAAIALPASGAIFPLALLFAAIFKCPFMKDKSAIGDVMLPAFISMLLFWPMLIAAAKTAPELVPLILAIGMSLHWPVIGWSYGRTGLFSAHAVIRALFCLAIFSFFPERSITWMPIGVAAIYGLTVLAILADVRRLKTRP